MEDGSAHNRLGGLGSGIAWTGEGDRFVMVPDRGAGDGAVSYRCRFHTLSIRVEPGAPAPVACELTQTTFFNDATGSPLIGLAAALPTATGPRRFDPEAIRVTPEGTLIVADEYGPSLVEFDREGHWLREWSLPAGITADHYGATPPEELPPRNTRGRQPNRGFEGLALTPDGRTLVALLQGPLLQDGALNSDLKRRGSVVRLLTIDRASGKTTQFAYLLDAPAHGLNEIEALSDQEFLVIERDGKGGDAARFKRIAKISLAGATSLDPQRDLTNGQLPADVRPVSKSWFIDLLDPRWGLVGEDFPEKTEGLAVRRLPNGNRLLFVTSDNDFQPEVPTRIDVFALPPTLAP